MKYFVSFFVSALCCTAVLGYSRPLEPNTLHLDTRENAANYRLPNNTKPETYDITLWTYVDEDKFEFNGIAVIQLRALEETSNISLHYRQLTITNIQLRRENSPILLGENHYDIVTEILSIPTKTNLAKDQEYVLTITYNGTLRGENGADLKGFYRSSYTDSQGIKRWLATTQFESTDARHAFPCYDEPALKANFTVRIEHGKKYTAVSNMPATHEEATDDGRAITEFKTTPPVSTYLIAFLVSDFGYTEKNASDTNPTKQRVYTNNQYLNQTSYALDEGVNILNAISDYVGVKYSLPKMDQAAIPDFSAGAMENWGLVTYKEQYLLFDPSIHLPSRKLKISTIIAHEFGHQWFGDLVSPKFWQYIWLNEGFATLFEYLGTGLAHSDWDIFSYFVTNQLQPVLKSDARADTRPMNTYQESPNGISNLFDSVAYGKAGSVIRMFLHALHEDTFKKGLKYYLEQNAYNASDENDLFEALDQAAKEDKTIDASLNVKDLFGSWSNKKGFPVLIVSRNSNGSVTLTQQKYDSIYKSNETDPSLWWIPYNYASASNPVFKVTAPSGWLSQNTREQILNSDQNTNWTDKDWLLFNRQQTGFYRVLYDKTNYDLVNNELNDGDINKIHPISRAQYIDDLADFVNTGRVPPSTLFSALSYLKKENEYAPWVSARGAINDLKQILAASTKLRDFGVFVSKLVDPLFKNKTLNADKAESVFDVLSRNIIFNLACEFGVENCLNETYTLFHDFIQNSKKPEPYNRGIIFANGIRQADEKEIDRFYSYFLNVNLIEERAEALASFGNIQNKTYIERILNKTVEETDTKLTKSDRLSLIQTITNGGQAGLTLTIEFLHRDLEKVNETIGSLNTILNTVAKKIVTSEVGDEFSKLLDHAQSKGLTSGDVDALKKTVSDRVSWQNEYLKAFEDSIPNSAAPLAALPGLLVLLFCLVRWNA